MTIQTEQLELLLHLKKNKNVPTKQPMNGFFLEIVKGQLEITQKDPDNYLWHSFFNS